MNPIIKFDKKYSRPAGRIFTYENRLYRLTQDGTPTYGTQVFALEISELTEESYIETLAFKKPIVTKTEYGWNAAGMHHVDLHRIGNKWISAVDGRSRSR